jgi:hypothetical protein
MAVKFIAAGGDEDFGIAMFGGTDGTPLPTASSTVVHGSHQRSITFDNTNANTSDVRANGVVADAGGRISVYVYFSTMSGASSNGLIQLAQSGSTTATANIRISSAGVLGIYVGGSPTQIGSNGATLSTGVWYRLTFCWTISSSTVNSFKLYVNGTLSASGSNATLTNTGSADVRFGNCSGDTSEVLYMSDFYIDNDTSLNDTGDIWVTAKRPYANGTTNNFSMTGTGSGYGSGNAVAVNERPLSTSSYVSVTPTSTQTEEYTLETRSQGDIDLTHATIVGYMGWMDAKIASTSNSPVMKIIVAGTSTSKTLTTSNAVYTQVAGSTSYPAGNTDIGMSAAYTTTGHLVTLNECGIAVAYIPGAAANPGQFFPFF